MYRRISLDQRTTLQALTINGFTTTAINTAETCIPKSKCMTRKHNAVWHNKECNQVRKDRQKALQKLKASQSYENQGEWVSEYLRWRTKCIWRQYTTDVLVTITMMTIVVVGAAAAFSRTTFSRTEVLGISFTGMQDVVTRTTNQGKCTNSKAKEEISPRNLQIHDLWN